MKILGNRPSSNPRNVEANPSPSPNPNTLRNSTLLGLDIPRKDVDGLFDTFDPDGGGEIDTEEFISKMDTFSQEQAHSPLQVLSPVDPLVSTWGVE